MPIPARFRKLPLATLVTCLFSAAASAQPGNGGSLAYQDDFSQVGVGVDQSGNITGELKYLLSGDTTSGTVGELWASDGAGGLKFSHNWIPADADGKPDRTASVRKVFAALDQNSLQDRKFTLGGGLEDGRGFLAAYLSTAASGSRRLAPETETAVTTVEGVEDGRPYVDTITTLTTTNIYERPFDWGVGVRAGRYLPEYGVQVTLGADHEWGDNDASQTSVSLDMEKYFQGSPWSVALRAEAAVRDDGVIGREDDVRGWLVLRYAFAKPPRSPATYTIRTMAPAPAAAVAAATAGTPGAGGETAPRPGATDAVETIPAAASTAAAPATPVAEQTLDPKVYSYRTDKRMVKTTASMSADAFFKFDSAEITPTASKELGKIADLLGNQGYADRITLTGHTCDIGSEAYNQRLSLRRAESVKRYLVDQGRIKADDIATIGKGESEPAYPNTRATRHQNRRVDVEFLTYVDREETITVPVPVEPAAVATAPAATAPAVAAAPIPMARPVPVKAPEAKPAPAPEVLWRSEEVEPEPDWIQHGLFGSIPHKRTVDYYRVTRRSVATTSERSYVNRDPLAGDDSYTVMYGIPLSLTVLDNDSDPDNDTLAITSISQPALGHVVISGSTLVYTPASAGASGSDSFTYTLTDGNGGSATATVRLTLIGNQAPVALNDSYTSFGGQSVSMAVLANDSDPDGDALTITSVGQASKGTVQVAGNNLVYTPTSATETGSDSFSYSVGDGKGGTATATVTVTLLANQAPTAMNDAYRVPGMGSTLLDVLANDGDPDGDPVSILSFTQPGFGSITLEGDLLRFTSTTTFTWTTFSYTIGDGNGGTASAIVTLVDP
jgi:outer membrane protein OmpA-like peptidoglycan-associated protein